MSGAAFFDLNHQAMPESRKLNLEGDSLTARQLVGRAAIDRLLDDYPTFSRLYIASSPYRRELFGFYPATVSMGRFVLESHVSSPTSPECSGEQCGAVLYDRGFISLNGLQGRDELKDTNAAFQWLESALGRIDDRTPGHNPLLNGQACEYLREMYDNGHHFMEMHNQREVDYSFEGSGILAKIPTERMPYRISVRE